MNVNVALSVKPLAGVNIKSVDGLAAMMVFAIVALFVYETVLESPFTVAVIVSVSPQIDVCPSAVYVPL